MPVPRVEEIRTLFLEIPWLTLFNSFLLRNNELKSYLPYKEFNSLSNRLCLEGF